MYKESSNQQLVQAVSAQITFDAASELIGLSGAWLWSTINEKQFALQLSQVRCVRSVTITGKYMDAIDTTGIYFIVRIQNYLRKHNIKLLKLDLSPDDQKLFDRIFKTLVELKLNRVKIFGGNLRTDLPTD